jgi:hypothetical protein
MVTLYNNLKEFLMANIARDDALQKEKLKMAFEMFDLVSIP